MKKILLIFLVLLFFATALPNAASAISSLSVITFVIEPATSGSYANYIIDMQLSSDLSTDNYIYMDFPSGFALPETISKTSITIKGEPPAKIDVLSGGIMRIYPAAPIQKGTEAVIHIKQSAKIKNPMTPGNFGFLIGVSNESNPQSVSREIRKGIGQLSVTVQPNTSNSSAMYLISFYTSENGALNGSSGDYITIVFPDGIHFKNSKVVPNDVVVNGVLSKSVELNNQILTIYLDNNLNIPASSFVSVEISAAETINPALPGNYFISVLTNKDPFLTNTSFNIKGTKVNNFLVTLNPRIQNASPEIKLSFITSAYGNLKKYEDEIFIKFPGEFYFPNSLNFSKIKVNGVTCSSGEFNSGILSIHTPIDIQAGAVTIIIDKSFGIKNPSVKGEYILDAYTSKDLMPASLSVQIESSHITAPVVALSNFGAGANSSYGIVFYTGAGGMLSKGNDKISIVFPDGTVLPQIIEPANIKVNNVPLTSAVNISQEAFNMVVPIDISANMKVSIEISDKVNIKNPTNGGIYTLSAFTSKETTPVFSVGYDISILPRSSAKVVPDAPNGKNGYYITKPKVALSAISPKDPKPAIYYYIDNNSPAIYVGDEIVIPDGTHTLYYYAIDHDGNKENVINSVKFKVDTTPPILVITSPTKSSVSGSTVKIMGKAEQNDLVQINGSNAGVKDDGTFELIVNGNGKTTFKVIALDQAGNSSEKDITITFNSQPAQPPNLTIISPQNGTVVYQSSVIITGKTDPGAEITINKNPTQVSDDGSFTATINIVSGENIIDVVALKSDEKSEVKLTVKFVKAVSIKLQIGNKNAIVNGEVISLDAPPVIVNSRTLVPLRFISESFGADVKWDAVLKLVDIKFNGIDVKLVIGNKFASVNGKKVELDSPPQIMNGRTMVPLRFISESLNAKVVWDNNTRTITITYP